MATSSFQAEQQTITLAITQRGGRAINNELRQRLIDAHQTGVTYRQMERLYGVKRDTDIGYVVPGNISLNLEVAQEERKWMKIP